MTEAQWNRVWRAFGAWMRERGYGNFPAEFAAKIHKLVEMELEDAGLTALALQRIADPKERKLVPWAKVKRELGYDKLTHDSQKLWGRKGKGRKPVGTRKRVRLQGRAKRIDEQRVKGKG